MMDLSSLSYEEKIDLLLVYGGAAFLGVGSIVFRIQSGRPTGGLDASVFQFQYMIAFIFLGAVTLLRTRVRTPGGAFLTTGLIVAMIIGLFFPAVGTDFIDIISYLLVAILVLFGGILHYRLNRPTNAQAIAIVALLSLEFYLYGAMYSVLAFVEVGNPILLVATLVLTVILYGTGRILIREYNNSYSDAFDSITPSST